MMSKTMIIIIVIIVLLVLWVISCLNSFARKKMKVDNAFADMDVHLVKRYDLIPNVVNTVKGYAKHEKQTLEDVISARNKAVSATNVDEKVNADNEVTQAISRLFALTESYPDLKANTNFLDLQKQLTSIENEIAGARKYYNAAVKKYNYAIAVIPRNIVAKIFGYKPIAMFAATGEQRNNVEVNFD